MPVEIREVIIKTEITSQSRKDFSITKEKEMIAFKKQMLEECKRMLTDSVKRKNNKR